MNGLCPFREAPPVWRGFLFAGPRRWKKEVVMKFIIIIWVVRVLAGWLLRRPADPPAVSERPRRSVVYHPAEYPLR